VVKDKIVDHFLTNKLFSDKQFGFLKGRSTVTQLLTIMDHSIEMLETGGRIDVLEKAAQGVAQCELSATCVVVDAVLLHGGKSRRGGHRIANISRNCGRI